MSHGGYRGWHDTADVKQEKSHVPGTNNLDLVREIETST